jgi:hypothetical protein
MKRDNKRIVELIGVFAVVASLVFVGMQLQLDRRLALANLYAFRAESYKSDFRTQLESDSNMTSLAAAWGRGERPVWWNEDLEEYTSSNQMGGLEIHSRILRATILFYHIDNLYFQAESGFYDPDLWLSVEDTFIKVSFRNPASIAGNYFRFEAQEGGIERPIDRVMRKLIAEVENENR